MLEGVVVYSEHLQVVLETLEVDDRLFQVYDFIRANGQHVQLVEVVQTTDLGYLVLVQGEVLELSEFVHAFHLRVDLTDIGFHCIGIRKLRDCKLSG